MLNTVLSNRVSKVSRVGRVGRVSRVSRVRVSVRFSVRYKNLGLPFIGLPEVEHGHEHSSNFAEKNRPKCCDLIGRRLCLQFVFCFHIEITIRN